MSREAGLDSLASLAGFFRIEVPLSFWRSFPCSFPRGFVVFICYFLVSFVLFPLFPWPFWALHHALWTAKIH